MSCKFCENLTEQEIIEKDDYVSLEGPDFESDYGECNCKARIASMGSIADESDRAWIIRFIVDEEWVESVPVIVGDYYSSNRTEVKHSIRTGFECDEWFDIKYCPMCGRDLLKAVKS